MPVEECVEKYRDVLKVVEYLIEARLAKEEGIRRAFIGTAKCLWDLSYEKKLVDRSKYEEINDKFGKIGLILEGKAADGIRLKDIIREVSEELLKYVSIKCSKV